MRRIFLFVISLFVLIGESIGQEPQSRPEEFPIKVQYVSLRPARWEEKALIEEINEKRNLGGLVLVYYKNI